ncbi:hypothetical protein [Streptomyces sp. RTd22]|uniref:hypothetical protein n=1 Tax=Streptomyces sp. RTd22 TaxID=1841249 RepID=UPI0007C50DB2|nr:hypothetical protein [Streptomyces sp. RTd22]
MGSAIGMISVGIGSVVMNAKGKDYIFLAWAADFQPVLGILLAGAGCLLGVTQGIKALKK